MRKRFRKGLIIRVICAFLLISLMFSLTGCKKNEKNAEKDNDKHSEERDDRDKEHDEEKKTEDEHDKEKIKNTEDRLVYIKDREMFSFNTEEGKTKQVTSGFGTEAVNRDLRDLYVLASSDSKAIVYLIRDEDTGKNLYYNKLDGDELYTIKIDDNVDDDHVRINDQGTLITYRKDNGRTLHQYNILTGEKSDLTLGYPCDEYWMSDDGNTIIYLYDDYQGDEDKDITDYLMIKEFGQKEKTIFSGRISNDFCVSHDATLVIFHMYKKNTGWCNSIWEKGKGIVQLDTDLELDMPRKVCNNGELYYVDFDMVIFPENELENLDVYEEKALMPQGFGETVENGERVGYITVYSMFYFDGKKAEKIGTDVGSGNVYGGTLTENPMIVFYENNFGNSGWYIAFGGEKKLITDNPRALVNVTDDGRHLFYFEPNEGEEDCEFGNLYKMRISNSDLGKPEIVAENIICGGQISILEGENVLYMRAGESEKSYNVYMNNILIQSIDQQRFYYIYDQTTKKLYYILLENDGKADVPLYVFSDGTSKKIDEISYEGDLYLTFNGNILYLKNYNTDKYLGDLYYYDDEIRQIDSDVISIVHLIQNDDIRFINYNYDHIYMGRNWNRLN